MRIFFLPRLTKGNHVVAFAAVAAAVVPPAISFNHASLPLLTGPSPSPSTASEFGGANMRRLQRKKSLHIFHAAMINGRKTLSSVVNFGVSQPRCHDIKVDGSTGFIIYTQEPFVWKVRNPDILLQSTVDSQADIEFC